MASPFQSLMKQTPSPRSFRVGLQLAFGAATLGTLAYNSVFTVDGGHKAVIFSKIGGVLPKVYGEGWHLKIPWFWKIHIFNVRTRATQIPSLTGSKDLQMVNITLRVLTKPKWEALPWIYQHLGHDYDQRVLPSIVNEVLKSVVAHFNVSQLITQRDIVSSMIQTRLQERAMNFNLELDDVSITQLDFGTEYRAAVEAKQVAQQEAERAKFLVEKAQQDSRSIVVRAQGDAESARMVGEAIKANPAYLELRRIELAKEIAALIAKSQNKVYLNSELLLLNLMQAIGIDEAQTPQINAQKK